MSSPPSLSACSSSLSSEPHTLQYPLPLTQAYLYDTYCPGALHHVPCTVDQYFELPFPNEDKYELVEGILFWKGEMSSRLHDQARDRIAAEVGRHYEPEGYEIVVERGMDASSSKQDSRTVRRPDIAVYKSSSTPNWESLSPKSKKMSFPRGYPPLLVVEITSPSNRNDDLNGKWDDYEQSAVQCYVIVDRAHEKDPSVIVGTLSDKGKYTKRVYRGDDVVDCLLFDKLGFSAQYLLNPPRTVQKIHNSPVKKLKNTISRKDHKIRDLEHENREKDQKIRELMRKLKLEEGGSNGNAHGSKEKQGSSSSNPKNPASKGGSSSMGKSQSKASKHNHPKAKK